MVATDWISTLDIGRSIPSTSTSGSELFHDEAPRIWIFGSSSPGRPWEAVVITPGRLPVRAAPMSVIPAARSSTSPVVCVMAPTTEAFFCWPKPTTITSESWVLSLSVTLNVRCLPTLNSRVFIPTYEMTMVDASDGTLRVKLPSKSVTVPTAVFPLITTEAPIKASPFESTTVPLMAMP